MARNHPLDDFLLWSALPVYLAVWIGVPSYLLGAQFWPLGLCWGAVYVAMHVYEITARGHCYLSADSTAFPVTFIVFLASLGVLYVIDPQPRYAPGGMRWFGYLAAFSMAFAFGHIAALLYTVLLDKLLKATILARASGAAMGSERRADAGGSPLTRLRKVEEEIRGGHGADSGGNGKPE